MDPNEHEKASLPTPQAWVEGLNRAILDSALDCIIVMNAGGRVLEFNPAAERVFGYTREQAVGQELAELIIPTALRERHRQGLRHFFGNRRRPGAGTTDRD